MSFVPRFFLSIPALFSSSVFGLCVRSLSYSRKRNRIPSALISPSVVDTKARIFEKNADGPWCELVTVLGMDRFAFREMEINVCCRDAPTLLPHALQVISIRDSAQFQRAR